MSAVDLPNATTLAAMQGFLKEDNTVHALTDNINREAPFFGRVRRSSKEVRGLYANIPLDLKGSRNAVGARAELDDMPTPSFQKSSVNGSGGGIKGQISIRYNAARIAFTEAAIQASMKQHGSFVSATTHEMQGITKDLGDDLNRQHIAGDGTGRLCRIAAVGAAPTYSVDQPGGQVVAPAASDQDGALFLEVGDVCAVYSAAGGFRAQLALTGIDRSLTPNEVTFSGAIAGAAIGDHLVKASQSGATGGEDDAFGKEVEGMMLWLSETSTAANVSPLDAGNERWKASVIDHSASPVAITDEILDQQIAQIRMRAGQAADSDMVHWTTYALKNAFAANMYGDKRFANTLTLEGGHQVVTHAGRPIMVDRHCLPGHWMSLTWSDLYCYNQGGFYWYDRDGVQSRIPNKAASEMLLLFFSNFGGPRRNVQGLIKGLKEPNRVTVNY